MHMLTARRHAMNFPLPTKSILTCVFACIFRVRTSIHILIILNPATRSVRRIKFLEASLAFCSVRNNVRAHKEKI